LWDGGKEELRPRVGGALATAGISRKGSGKESSSGSEGGGKTSRHRGKGNDSLREEGVAQKKKGPRKSLRRGKEFFQGKANCLAKRISTPGRKRGGAKGEVWMAVINTAGWTKLVGKWEEGHQRHGSLYLGVQGGDRKRLLSNDGGAVACVGRGGVENYETLFTGCRGGGKGKKVRVGGDPARGDWRRKVAGRSRWLWGGRGGGKKQQQKDGRKIEKEEAPEKKVHRGRPFREKTLQKKNDRREKLKRRETQNDFVRRKL